MDAKEFGRQLQFVGKLLEEGKEVEFRLPGSFWQDIAELTLHGVSAMDCEFREKPREPREKWEVTYAEGPTTIFTENPIPQFRKDAKEVIHWREVLSIELGCVHTEHVPKDANIGYFLDIHCKHRTYDVVVMTDCIKLQLRSLVHVLGPAPCVGTFYGQPVTVCEDIASARERARELMEDDQRVLLLIEEKET